MKVLLTGVTGAIGSCHVPNLLERGHEVTCLVRGKDPYQRVAKILGSMICGQIRVLSGDITQPLGGVNWQEIQPLKFDCLVHHAGSVKFDKDAKAEIQEANVEGTRHMLSLAEKLEIPFFCYNSSVFALNQPHRNPYEVSKKDAEALVRQWQGGRHVILRPSIVVGDSKTGAVNNYTGYYGFFSGLSWLKHNLRKLWDKDSLSCINQGFNFDHNDTLILEESLWLEYSSSSTLNLVPVDWLVKAITDIMEQGERGQIYNLANTCPPKVAWIVKTSLEILGIQGVKQRQLGEFVSAASSPILRQWQEHTDQRLERYLPYVTGELEFGCEALATSEFSPVIDRAFLETMLKYAMSTRFGHSKD